MTDPTHQPVTTVEPTTTQPATEPETTSVAEVPASRTRDVRKVAALAGSFGLLVGVILGALGWGLIDSARDTARAEAAVAAEAKAEADAAAAAEEARQTVLKDAVSACSLTNDASAELGDDNQSLTLDNKGDDDFEGLPIGDVACVLNDLAIPDGVLSQVEQTTALDGRQNASWGDVEMSWSYHPDRGLDSVLTVTTES